ncbi:hypothetical protein BGW39_011118 [Mortierella sp. 14UC]|nr:hypothetical protein BGW39_011118 [Mortierella sp. 14UC]
MPLLIQAVPLAKNWLGGYYWRTPALDTLPEELEYLPREEIKHRFEKLNLIAARTYPTVWPNIAVLFFVLALTGAAAYALSKIRSSNLAIMGQGICFILPIIIIVWVKVRKETKARARRRFKHQSQKLLRAWTAQDTQSHAMQWKIRLRSKTIANPWIVQGRHSHRRRGSSRQQGDIQSQYLPEQVQHHRRRLLQPQEQEQDQLQDHHLLSFDEQQQLQLQHQQHFHAGTTVISMTDALQLDNDIPQTHDDADDAEGSDIATLHRVSWVDPRRRREHNERQGDNNDVQVNQRPPSFIHLTPEQDQQSSVSSPAPPSAIVSMYQTFRARTQRRRAATVDSLNASLESRVLQQQHHQGFNMSVATTATTIATSTPNSSPATASIPTTVPTVITHGEPPILTTYSTGGPSIWSIFKESMSNSLCCGMFSREPKVWLIEISLRECQLDEYALMVPSPVYCDYRLPGYDDAVAGTVGGVVGAARAAGGIGLSEAGAGSSRTALNRYNGLPPAYESESDSDGEDDDDLDEDEDEDDDLETDSAHALAQVQIQDSLECRLTRPAPAHFADTGSNTPSSSSMDSTLLCSQPEMEMIQRPVEMTSVIVLTTPPPAPAAGTSSPQAFPISSCGPNSNGNTSSQGYTHDLGRGMTRSSTSIPSLVEQPQLQLRSELP